MEMILKRVVRCKSWLYLYSLRWVLFKVSLIALLSSSSHCWFSFLSIRICIPLNEVSCPVSRVLYFKIAKKRFWTSVWTVNALTIRSFYFALLLNSCAVAKTINAAPWCAVVSRRWKFCVKCIYFTLLKSFLAVKYCSKRQWFDEVLCLTNSIYLFVGVHDFIFKCLQNDSWCME